MSIENNGFGRIVLILVFLFSLLVGFSAPEDPKKNDPSLLTLERIFSSNEFELEQWGPAHWLEDGTGYTILERAGSEQKRFNIVKYNFTTGKREVLVPSERLIPSGKKSPLSVEGYEWSKDRTKLLIFTNTKRVWRQNTRGDYWVLDLKDWTLHKLGGDAEPSTLMFAKFSPDGNRVGYVIKNNIYVEDLRTKEIIALTRNGSENIINGTFDWVYEEELGLRDGFRWSPDGKWIAYWQLNTEGVKTFYMINNIDSLYPKLIPIKYPKVGTRNSATRIGIVSSSGGETRWFKLEGDPRNHYLARMEWAESAEEVCFQRLNRLQNTNWFMIGNRKKAEVRTVFVDRDDAWVDVNDNVRWINGGKRFLWLSEKDGWRHLYSVSRRSGEALLLTPGKYDVESLEGVDETNGWAYFIASPDNPTRRFLFLAPLNGSGKVRRITPPAQKGVHAYNISPDGRWAFHTYSSFGTPPVIELVSLPDHKVRRIIAANKALREKVERLKRQPVEFFRVNIGKGIELDGWCMKPSDFDSKKKYPLLFYVYGEPAGTTVIDRWGGERYLWHLMLTQQGYLVMSIDNRGTKVPRGRAWRKSIYRQVGILAPKDQAAAARVLLKERPYIDPERIATWGWSGGGQMSLNMIFRYPEIYNTAMAVAFVSNQRYYDTIYQERYMGLPEDNAENFKNGSPITWAHRLKGNLLLAHGTLDDNVHFQSCEALVDELIKHNKQFFLMIYPNRTHAIKERENSRRHLHELMTRFLNRCIPPGPKE